MYQNEIIRTPKGRVPGAPPWIRQCTVVKSVVIGEPIINVCLINNTSFPYMEVLHGKWRFLRCVKNSDIIRLITIGQPLIKFPLSREIKLEKMPFV